MAGERRRRLGSVRVRTTAGAVLVVGVALAAGAIVLVYSLRANLTDGVRTGAALRADDVADLLDSGSDPRDLVGSDDDDGLIQIVDEDGRVVAASDAIAGRPPIARLEDGESAEVEPLTGDDDEFLAVAVEAETEGGRLTVLVARALDDVDDSTEFVGGWLAFGIPALLLVVGFTTWRVVGRALAPVESIRAEVDAISAAEMHRRVPEPGTADEIARLAATMNRMLERLEASQARQRRFVSDASHELRSPVASIRQYAEVALAHPDRLSTVELAETVLAEDLRVQHLVDDLLLLTRADEHMLNLAARPVDVDDLVFAEANHLRATSALRVDTRDVSAGRIRGDDRALARVLRNLATNAARHAHERVGFTLSDRDGDVLVTVEDDGPGIPPDARGRVFERFVRLDDARARDDGGSGLGLAIVSELVAALGGSVAVGESALGGARFEIRIPADSGGTQGP